MNWFEALVAAYDDNAHLVGVHDVEGSRAVLAPIGHFIQNAPIEITLDESGNLLHADVVAKAEQPTLMPCTQASASRTSGLVAHPLCNQLRYVARDAEKYQPSKEKKSKGDKPKTAYELFVDILSSWVAFDPNPKLCAVHKFVTQHDAIHELVQHKILFLDDKGGLLEKWTDKTVPKPLIYSENTGELLKATVRWRVVLDGDKTPELWKDVAIQQSFIRFYMDSLADTPKELCYATGEFAVPAVTHNKFIRFAGDGAKLISANATGGDDFTFRGRWAEPKEAISVGYEASQKCMNALAWLIRNQGINIDGCVFLAWGSKGTPTPRIADNTSNIIRRRGGTKTSLPNTMRSWAESFGQAIKGYRHEFEQNEGSHVNIMVVDAPTQGRLSICYHSEIGAEEFLERIERWHINGRWKQHAFGDENKLYTYYGVPSPKVLVDMCCGENASDKMRKAEINKLFACILDGTPIPLDMERKALSRVCRRANVDNYKAWRRTLLEPVCSVVVNRLHSQEEVFDVALNENCRDRSYLFGRLLSIADWAERSTYDKDKFSRSTNAIKFFEAFQLHPARVWLTLQSRIMPYLRQRDRYGGYERKLISHVGDMFEHDDFESNKPLGGKFLLGFYSQDEAFRNELMARIEAKKKKNAVVNGEDFDDECIEQED